MLLPGNHPQRGARREGHELHVGGHDHGGQVQVRRFHSGRLHQRIGALLGPGHDGEAGVQRALPQGEAADAFLRSLAAPAGRVEEVPRE